jgi:hypothetical protein
MQDGIRLPQVIEELVPESSAFVGIRDKTGDIDQVYGHETVSIPALTADQAELMARAAGSDVGNPEVRIDGGKRVVRYLGVGHGGRLKKG